MRARAALEDERAAEAAQAARLRATLAELESRADADRAAAASAQAEQSRSQLAQSQAALERAQADLHLVTTERNRLRRLAESVQTDMRRLNGALASKAAEVEKAQQENQRLREDLARKSKSLQDALTALAVAMEAPPPGANASGSGGMGSGSFPSGSSSGGGGGGGSSGGGGGGGGETIIVAAPIHSQKPSAANLSALQVLCTRLSEACAEKEAQISVLKKQCLGLGKRVIELEAGVLPDFSELAHERRVAAASAAGGGGEESAASATSAPSSSSSSSAEPHRLVHATSDGSEPRSSGVTDYDAASAAAATTPSPISSPLVPLVPSDPLSPGSVLLRSANSSRRTSADPAVIVSHETPSATAATLASRPDFTGRSASPDDAATFPTLPHGDRTAAAGDAPAGASQHSDALP